MPLLFFIRKISLALSFLMLAGCAELNPSYGYSEQRYSAPYVQSDFDELLVFGANMANISPSSRAEVCRTLLKRDNGPPGAEVWLHMLVGRLLSDSCGDIPRILDGVASIPMERLNDERMRRFVIINTETLKRLQNVSRKASSQERKQKAVQTVPESKDTNGSGKNEARLLREKLEAIRSMEKHLDESGGAN